MKRGLHCCRKGLVVENRNNIVIENIGANIDNNSNKTYAEIVSSKQEPMMSVSCCVSLRIDETQRNKKEKDNLINQGE
jgi:hypothetical protein